MSIESEIRDGAVFMRKQADIIADDLVKVRARAEEAIAEHRAALERAEQLAVDAEQAAKDAEGKADDLDGPAEQPSAGEPDTVASSAAFNATVHTEGNA